MQRLEAEAQCERVWCKGEVEAEAKATSNSEGGVQWDLESEKS